MTLRSYLLLMSVSTLVSIAAWFGVVNSVNPFSGEGGALLFYLTLFLSLVGILSIIGLLARRPRSTSRLLLFRSVIRAFRQAIFASLLVASALALAHAQWLTWWNTIILILLAVCIEAFFIAKKDSPAGGIRGI